MSASAVHRQRAKPRVASTEEGALHREAEYREDMAPEATHFPAEPRARRTLRGGTGRVSLARRAIGRAGRVGFEPTVPLRVRRFSRPVHSTTLTPARVSERPRRRPLRLRKIASAPRNCHPQLDLCLTAPPSAKSVRSGVTRAGVLAQPDDRACTGSHRSSMVRVSARP
jgi:hypothetical protein